MKNENAKLQKRNTDIKPEFVEDHAAKCTIRGQLEAKKCRATLFKTRLIDAGMEFEKLASIASQTEGNL